MSAAHHPLCLSLRLEWRTPEPENCDVCAALTAARADEREKVVDILNGLPRIADDDGNEYHDWTVSDVVRAVRDELDIPDADVGEGIDNGGES